MPHLIPKTHDQVSGGEERRREGEEKEGRRKGVKEGTHHRTGEKTNDRQSTYIY